MSWFPTRRRLPLPQRPEVRIRINTNVAMSRHKAAAQAVHAALAAFGIEHGRVVVLGGRPDEVRAMDVVVHDAGRTEVEPGTLTAGASLVPPERHEA